MLTRTVDANWKAGRISDRCMFHRRDEDSQLAMFHQRRFMTRITAGPTRTGIVSAIMKISLLMPPSNVASERTLSKGNKLVNNNNIWPEWHFFLSWLAPSMS